MKSHNAEPNYSRKGRKPNRDLHKQAEKLLSIQSPTAAPPEKSRPLMKELSGADRMRADEEMTRLASFPLLNPNPIVEIDSKGCICFANPAAERLFPDLWQLGTSHPWMAHWNSLPSNSRDEIEKPLVVELQVIDRWYNQALWIVPNTRNVRIYGVDITDRKRAESLHDLAASILKVLNQGSDDMTALIGKVLHLIRESTGFHAAGLRMRRGDDYPYYEQSGFPDEFIREENFLCEKQRDGSNVRDENGLPVLECTCGLVLSGRTDPSLPFFTEGGSFWINSSLDLLAFPGQADPRTNPRNRCIQKGYQSVALIPVRSGQEIIGLLQLNDSRAGRHSLELVRFFEGLGDQIGLALKRKLVEEELKSLNETLEHRVRERSAEAEYRAAQLRKLALELTLAEQRERQRLAMVLHDGLQQILVGAKFQLSFIERSQNVYHTANQVVELIDDAIETSRSLTAELSPPILLQEDFFLALEWLARWMRTRYELDVSLVARENITPLTEEMTLLLFQAVRELLFNVVKHAGVKAACIRVNQENGWLVITVEDEGRGFDPSQLRTEGGQPTGMGLFAIKERVSCIGGRVEIDSAPGQGSRFRLIIPNSKIATDVSLLPIEKQVQISVATLAQSGSEAAGAEGKIRVLVVDDHIIMRQGLVRLLRGEKDMEIAGEASDGEAAVGLVRALLPDVVLMDVSMPGMDGIQATRIIRSEMPEIHVIGLSMFQEGEHAAAMREAGADDYVAKSGPAEAVINAIRACVRSQPSQAHQATMP